MEFDYRTLDDFELRDKRVLLRLDINVPLDPTSKRILDEGRIIAAIPTIDALAASKVTVLSHQSRPGKDDFTSLQQHATILQSNCSQLVRFVDDVMGPAARQAIRDLRSGEVLVLDNVRFCAEENLEDVGEKLARTNLVSRLSPFFDLYVNDAFATSHRSQASLVGFPYLLPSAAGKLMERELAALKKLFVAPVRPSTYVLGGAKVEDKVPVIENILATGKADNVLVGGNVAKVFLKAADHKLSQADEQDLAQHTDELLKANRILSKYRKRIVLPTDFGIVVNGKRVDTPTARLVRLARGSRALDIGTKSAKEFAGIISRSKTVVASGPMGVFEEEGFESGTRVVLESMAHSDAFTVVGGGHLAGYAGILGISERLSHVSTAGGAMLSLLAGEQLPAIAALGEAAKRDNKRARP